MNFLKFFNNASESQAKIYSTLYSQFKKEFENLSEEQLLISSCVAGLLARVSYVDFKLDEEEKLKIKEILKQFKFLETLDASVIATMAIDHIKEMAGLENHLYVHPLKNILNKDERYKIVQSLFLVAASDGSVDAIESEEIRLINKGLELSSQHFLAARAEVSIFLKSLK